MALQLDLKDHEKAQRPPLPALKSVARPTLALLGQVIYGAGGGAEKLSEEELGTVEKRAFGREGEEIMVPEGLCGFFV